VPLFCAVLLYLTALAGCGAMRLNSHWLDRPVNIDGFADDWEGLLTPVGKGAAYVGVMNDSNCMYLCVMTAKAQLQRRLVRQGLLVWFQPQDQDKAPLGIRYPVSVLAVGRTPRSGGPDQVSSDGRPPDDRAFTQELRVVEIVGPSNQDRRRVSIDSIPGVDVKVSGQRDWFVYELRIPLASPDRFPLAIDAKPGETVTVRLESEKPDMRMMGGGGHEGGHGGFGGGGFPGGGMGRGGPGAPGGQGGARQTPEQLNVSAKVQLAPAPPV
jgi:uncharacterized membrane protein YgcG